MASTGIILGSYAAQPEDALDRVAYQEAVRDLDHVSGLELPFTSLGLIQEGGLLPEVQLKQGAELVVTALPCQMERMAVDPHYGLASGSPAGRKTAVDMTLILFEQLERLLEKRPDVRLRGVELHSGPRPTAPDVFTSAEALHKSFSELVAAIPAEFRSKICIEHCDAGNPMHPPAKGFLKLAEELMATRDFEFGHVLNWGRSCLEGRDPKFIFKHLSEGRGRLRGLIFSGASRDHLHYGNWADTHAPIREAYGAGDDAKLLLTADEITDVLSEWNKSAARRLESTDRFNGNPVDDSSHLSHRFLGLKVQALPREMNTPARIDFIKRNLSVLWREINKYSFQAKT